ANGTTTTRRASIGAARGFVAVWSPRSQDAPVYLGLSFLALALGPLLVWLARRHAWSTVVLDSFCLLTIAGFALLHLLPESAEQGGYWLVLPLALVGFLLPTLAERQL